MKKMNIIVILSFIVALIFSGCQSSVRFSSEKFKSSYSTSTKSRTSKSHINYDINDFEDLADNIADEADSWRGTRYCWGGTTKKCVDCSGFMQNIFKANGVRIPRTAAQQYNFSEKVDKEDAKKGDMVFFRNTKKISHVGLYLGDNKFIHSSSKRGVVYNKLSDNYYKTHVAGFGRVLTRNISMK